MNKQDCEKYLQRRGCSDRKMGFNEKRIAKLIRDGFGYFGLLPKDMKNIIRDILWPKFQTLSFNLDEKQLLCFDVDANSIIAFNMGDDKYFILETLRNSRDNRGARHSSRIKYITHKIIGKDLEEFPLQGEGYYWISKRMSILDAKQINFNIKLETYTGRFVGNRLSNFGAFCSTDGSFLFHTDGLFSVKIYYNNIKTSYEYAKK